MLAPLTSLVGPAATYNAAAVALPALAAWTAYLLCRRVTARLWPSVAGGYVFGFSSYVLGQQFGHLHMTAVLLVPVVALSPPLPRGRARPERPRLAPRARARAAGVARDRAAAHCDARAHGRAAPRRAARPRGAASACVPASARLRARTPSPPLARRAAARVRADRLRAPPPPSTTPRAFSADLLNFAAPDAGPTAIGGAAAAGVARPVSGGTPRRAGRVRRACPRSRSSSGSRSPAGAPSVCALPRRRRGGRVLLAALGTALWVGGHRVVALPWALVAPAAAARARPARAVDGLSRGSRSRS